MKNEKKYTKVQKELFKTIRREKTRNYIILYAVTIILFLALFFFSYSKGYFSGKDFFIELLNNMIGILPPILIFDFFLEKLSRDSSAIETSQKITESLMGDPETLDLFSNEQRYNFISSTISSLVDDFDVADMINSNLKTYLHSYQSSKIRTEFIYNFELYSSLPNSYNDFVHKEHYFYVQEKLRYKVKYLSPKTHEKILNGFKIGFVFDNKHLDNALRDENSNSEFENCIFRESLDIHQEDIEYLRSLTQDEFINKFHSMFKIDVQIDSYTAEIDDVTLTDKGIIVSLYSHHNTTDITHTVRIIFHMPKRWDSLLEVALVDPTRAPKISVSYPEDDMQVDMFSFLSKGKESSLEVSHEHKNGIYDIDLENEWVYPISGLIFTVNKISEQ